jgi:excisionase family DNA binding protein
MKTINLQLSITLEDQSIAVLRELVRDISSELQAERARMLRQTQVENQKSPEEKVLLLGMREAAKLLGVSERTIWGMANEGKMPKPIRLGRAVRWSLDELRAWVNHGCPPQAQWNWPLAGDPAK